MRRKCKTVEEINIFGKITTVNRLTICVNRLTRSGKPPLAGTARAVASFLGVNRLTHTVNRLTRVKFQFSGQNQRALIG